MKQYVRSLTHFFSGSTPLTIALLLFVTAIGLASTVLLTTPGNQNTQRISDCSAGNCTSPVTNINNATQVSAGQDHACAVLEDHTVTCWGKNDQGQLGNGTTVTSATPVVVTGISNATQVSAGVSQTCALLTDGTVKCWGQGVNGQLGNGTGTSSSSPVSVSGITTATAVSAGNMNACALLTDGTVKCWGFNTYCQLGDGTCTSSSLIPVSVSGITTATAISTENWHACALLTDSTIKCWGLGQYGELGNGATGNASIPVAVTGISNAAQLGQGISSSPCVRLSDNTIKCWGLNNLAQLGTAPNGSNLQSATPIAVPGISTATQIAQSNNACAVLSDHTVTCWGDNRQNQLGNGIASQYSLPNPVVGITTATQVATGGSFSCTLLTDKTIKCWGDNTYGQLGNGAGSISPTPSVTPSVTITPTTTLAPSLTPALTLTPTPTTTPQPSDTPVPTTTPSPTAVPGVSANLSLVLPGIGSNTAIQENTAPRHPQRLFDVFLYDAGNNLTAKISTTLSFNGTSYTGTANFPGVSSGTYIIKVKSDSSLMKAVPGARSLTVGAPITIPQMTLVSGDIDNSGNSQNILDLSDYNLMLSGYGWSSDKDLLTADLNDDGKIDSKDLNILLRGFSIRKGD